MPKRTYVRAGGTWVDITSGAAIPTAVVAPASPATGQVYFNLTDSRAYIYNGTSWSPFQQTSDSTSTTSSTTSASSTAVKAAYDRGSQGITDAATAQSTANAAIPKSVATASGDILYATADSTITKLGKGTDGQVLTLASGLPSWAAPAGSVLITKTTLSGTSSIVYDNIPQTYRHLFWTYLGQSGGGLYLNTFKYNNATAISQIYLNATIATGTTTVTWIRYETTTTAIGTSTAGANIVGTGTYHGATFNLYAYSSTDSSKPFFIQGNATTTASSQVRTGTGNGTIVVGASSGITNFTVNWASSVTSGTAYLYGVL